MPAWSNLQSAEQIAYAEWRQRMITLASDINAYLKMRGQPPSVTVPALINCLAALLVLTPCKDTEARFNAAIDALKATFKSMNEKLKND